MRRALGLSLFCAAFGALRGSAFARPLVCLEVDKLLRHQRLVVEQVYDRGGVKIPAMAACNHLTELAEKSVELLNWIDENRVWCGAPDRFVASAENSRRQIIAARNWFCGRIISLP